MVIKKQKAKIDIRYSGRSSDYMVPDFVHNCIADCQYCYMRRFNPHGQLKIATNIDEILMSTLLFNNKLGKKTPNQVDENLWTYDIGCNNDFSISANYIDWQYIFDFGVANKLKWTFATKFVNKKLLLYNPNGLVRVRFSLQPLNMQWTESGTHPIIQRIQFLEAFFNAGYEVHLNFSPIIITDTWKEDYIDLFKTIKNNVSDNFLNQCKAEVIFLTHNQKLHEQRLAENKDESIFWVPEMQEKKISTYGGENLRYKHKHIFVDTFSSMLKENLDIPIRYIF